MKLIMVYKILYALLLHSAYAAVWKFEQSGKFTGEDVTFTSTVTLNGDLEITGPGPEQLATFIAASNNRHFITSMANTLRLTYIKLTGAAIVATNSQPSGYGGSILVAYGGILYATNCKFVQNSASAGGAISSYYGSKVTIVNTVFEDNQGKGGAIHLSHGTLNVTGSEFISNQYITPSHSYACWLEYGGGAITLVSTETHTISETTFTNNKCGCNQGHVIHASNNPNLDVFPTVNLEKIIINDCANCQADDNFYGKFFDCTQAEGTFSCQTDITLTKTTYLAANAQLTLTGRGESDLTILTAPPDDRHFIVTSTAIFSISYMKLTGGRQMTDGGNTDSTDGKGGSILILQYYSSSNSVTITSCIFSDNKAVYGGAINRDHYFGFSTSGTTTIEHTIFENNEATKIGGAIYHSKGSGLIILNSTFSSNKVTSGTESTHGGGAINIYMAQTATISSTMFNQNSANNNNGHAIYSVNYQNYIPTVKLIEISVTTCTTNSISEQCIQDDNIKSSVPTGMPKLCDTISPNPCPSECISHTTSPSYGIQCPCGADTYGIPAKTLCTAVSFKNHISTYKYFSLKLILPFLTNIKQIGLQCPSNTATIPGTVGATSINECYFYINNLSPNNQSTFGNKLTTFFGTGFDVDATYIIKTNENEWASVTAVSETEITAISPSGTGNNFDIDVFLSNTNGIKATVNVGLVFSYSAPNISKIISPPFNGGTIIIQGHNFGIQQSDITLITVYDDNGCSSECELLQVTIAPPEEILCKYSQVGSSGITREIDFFVGNQKSNRGSYSYDFDKGEISGIVSL